MKKAFFQLHIAVFLAGFTGVLGKVIDLNEGMIVWWRLLFTVVTMAVLFLAFKKIQKIPLKDILKICGVGLIAALHWLTFYGAIKWSNVSVALTCFSSISFFTAIFEPLLFKRKVNQTELLLGLLTIAGIYIIFHFDDRYKAGIITGIISAMLAAIFPIFNRQFLQRINVETMLLWQQTGGFITLSAILPFYFGLFPSKNFIPGWQDVLWLLVLAWVCSVFAFQLTSHALKRLSAFTVNLSYNLEPVYGILIAFIVFKENQQLGKWFYYGFAVIVSVLAIHIFILIMKERKIVMNNADDGVS
jgi:drug/metabolite transporter (DMT)-like permease